MQQCKQWDNAVFVNGGGYKAVRAAVAAKRNPGERGPQRTPTKQLVSVRYSPEVLSYFKASGAGWQTRKDEALKQWVSSKRSDGPNQASVRYRYQTLGIKGPGFEKLRRDYDLKPRPSHACRVRDEGDKRTVGFASSHAQADARADFRSKAKINPPDLTAWR